MNLLENFISFIDIISIITLNLSIFYIYLYISVLSKSDQSIKIANAHSTPYKGHQLWVTRSSTCACAALVPTWFTVLSIFNVNIAVCVLKCMLFVWLFTASRSIPYIKEKNQEKHSVKTLRSPNSISLFHFFTDSFWNLLKNKYVTI